MEYFFRGAGNLIHWHVGAARALQWIHSDFQKATFKGISSGGVVATLLACNICIERVMILFEYILPLYKAYYLSRYPQFSSCFRILLYFLLDNFFRFHLVHLVLKRIVTNELVHSHCNGRLTIVTFSLTQACVLERNEWQSANHLIEWIMAGMSIPITSPPRFLEGQYLMDAYEKNPARFNHKIPVLKKLKPVDINPSKI